MDGLSSQDIEAMAKWVRGFRGMETPRLWTRPLREDDAEALFDAIKNPRVNAWVAIYEQPFTLSTVRRFIAKRIERMAAGEGLWLGVFAHGCDVPMGWISADLEPLLAGVELGGALGELYWGKGFVEEATFALMNGLFNAGVSSVIATCAVGNYSSMRVILALNFERAGTMERPTPQGPRASLVFKLTPEGWRSAKLLPLGDGLSADEIAQRRRDLHALCRELKNARDYMKEAAPSPHELGGSGHG